MLIPCLHAALMSRSTTSPNLVMQVIDEAGGRRVLERLMEGGVDIGREKQLAAKSATLPSPQSV